jgi:ribosomal protein S18 acetylase RimI-like enzyme
MTEPLPLRPATPADVDALSALVNAAYRGDASRAGWTTEAGLLDGQRTDPELLRATLATPGTRVLVHEAEGRLDACVLLERTAHGCYLGMLTVRPTLQSGGLGKRLLAAAEAFASEQWGVRTMHMTVITLRTELIAWYERRGYARTGVYKPFPYGDEKFGLPRRDDLRFEVLEKALSPAAGSAAADDARTAHPFASRDPEP